MNSFVKHLLATSGLQISDNDITLSSGEKSRYYVDCRMLLLYSEFRKEVGEFFLSSVSDGYWDDVDSIGGKGIGSILLCIAIQEAMERNGEKLGIFTIRTSLKEHGIHPKLIGNIFNKKVIIVDDVITSGDTIIESIKFVRDAGAIVLKAVSLVDRSGRGTFKIKQETDVLTNYMFDLEELLQEKRLYQFLQGQT